VRQLEHHAEVASEREAVEQRHNVHFRRAAALGNCLPLKQVQDGGFFRSGCAHHLVAAHDFDRHRLVCQRVRRFKHRAVHAFAEQTVHLVSLQDHFVLAQRVIPFLIGVYFLVNDIGSFHALYRSRVL
jgi:hypothetical protein